MNFMLFTRNSSLQEYLQNNRINKSKYTQGKLKLFLMTDYDEAIDRLRQQDKPVHAIIADADSFTYKLVEYINKNRFIVVCAILTPILMENDEQIKRIQGYHGVNLVVPIDSHFQQIVDTVCNSVNTLNKVDDLFKDLLNANPLENENRFISTFYGDNLDEESNCHGSIIGKSALDTSSVVSSRVELDLNRFISQPKKSKKNTTVAGLDKRLTQHYWREYLQIGHDGSLSSVQSSTARSDGIEEISKDKNKQKYHTTNSTNNNAELAPIERRGSLLRSQAPSQNQLIRRISSISAASATSAAFDKDTLNNFNNENMDKLKIQKEAKKKIVKLSTSAPANIQLNTILLLDLPSLNINLAERDLLQKGLRYQDCGDFDRALSIFTTAGVRTAKPYISKILIGNLHYSQWNFLAAVKDYGDAIQSLSTCQDEKVEFVAYFNRAISCFRIGDDQRGLKHILHAQLLDPLNIQAVEILSLAQRRMGLHNEAIEGMLTLSKYRQEHYKAVENRDSSIAVQLHKTTTDEDAADASWSRDTNEKVDRTILRRQSLQAFMEKPSNRQEQATADMLFITPSPPIITLTIQPITNVKLKDLSVNYRNKTYGSSATGDVSQMGGGGGGGSSSVNTTLETFKLIHGFKQDLSRQLFDGMSPLQSALALKPGHRSNAQVNVIASSALSLFPFLKNCSKSTLSELAKVVKYMPISIPTKLYSQSESTDTIAFILSGAVQYSVESTKGDVRNIVIGELGVGEAVGHIDMLFTRTKGVKRLINLPRIQHELFQGHATHLTSSVAVDMHPNQGQEAAIGVGGAIEGGGGGSDDQDESAAEASSKSRTFHPHMFLSYNVVVPSEILLIRKVDFDKYLAYEALAEFNRVMDVIHAAKVFEGWNYPEKIRLARMGRVRTFRQGQIILEQGMKPEFLYFIMSGWCKVYKKPNDSDDILRRLKEARKQAERFDLKYTYHHRLRQVLSRAVKEEIPSHLRGHHLTKPEVDREHLRAEIQHLEEVLLSKQAEEKSESSYNDVGYTEVCDLYWPRLFGEACILDISPSGVSAGRIVAESSCDILMIHKTHLNTFHIGEDMKEALYRKSIPYPSDEAIALEENSMKNWKALKSELLKDVKASRARY